MEVSMKYGFDFSRLPDYVVIKTGHFSVMEDFYKLLRDLLASPSWQPGASLIIDHRELQLTRLEPKEITMLDSIIAFHREGLGDGKCALVLSPSPDSEKSPLPHHAAQFSLFHDFAQARQWLQSAR